MKIENPMIFNLSTNIKEINLKEGSVELFLTPIESQEGNENHRSVNPIYELHEKFNIKLSKLSFELVENFMKFNIPITKDSLFQGMKTLEKLESLVNLNDDENVVLLDNKSIVEQITENEKLENIDTSYFLVENNQEEYILKDIKNFIEEFLTPELKLSLNKSLPKIVSFFQRFEILPNLNNLKNYIEFNKDPLEFVRDLIELATIDNKIDSLPSEEFNSKELMDLIQEIYEAKTSILEEESNKLENKIEFLKEMNNNLPLILIPINFDKGTIKTLLTLINNNKKNNSLHNKFNVFINVNTNYLGKIKVLCQLSGNLLNVKINIMQKDLEFFQSTEKQLIEKIRLIGYSLKKIEFIIDDEFGLIDTLIVNQNPTFLFDMKV